ncbi:MAG: hypothetical protein LBJ92_04910 [Holosporales bacterium]|jgi:hypothetical protein|nr:hypothetical protein [Holosporales bacterium]
MILTTEIIQEKLVNIVWGPFGQDCKAQHSRGELHTSPLAVQFELEKIDVQATLACADPASLAFDGANAVRIYGLEMSCHADILQAMDHGAQGLHSGISMSLVWFCGRSEAYHIQLAQSVGRGNIGIVTFARMGWVTQDSEAVAVVYQTAKCFNCSILATDVLAIRELTFVGMMTTRIELKTVTVQPDGANALQGVSTFVLDLTKPGISPG